MLGVTQPALSVAPRDVDQINRETSIMRRILSTVIIAAFSLTSSGCIVVAVNKSGKNRIVEVEGSKYLIDEKGKAHKITDEESAVVHVEVEKSGD